MSAAPGWWQERGWIACLLYPLSLLFARVVAARARATPRRRPEPGELPVIVVGNISVGGTGKSPLVGHLAACLCDRGFRVGIVSRGYGGAAQRSPLMVEADSDPAQAGDEPVMHARLTGVPVCVCIERAQAVARLAAAQVEVVIADDGLQHYAMARTAEIAVLDGERGIGNGWLLPAGPLREPVSRFRSVDLVAIQTGNSAARSKHYSAALDLAELTGAAGEFTLHIEAGVCLADGEAVRLDLLRPGPVHAVTGLGNPQRFFDSLSALGLEVMEHVFDDHHRYTAQELHFDDERPVLVTSKDAVKIERLAIDLSRFVEVRVALQANARLQSGIDAILARLPAAAQRL